MHLKRRIPSTSKKLEEADCRKNFFSHHNPYFIHFAIDSKNEGTKQVKKNKYSPVGMKSSAVL